MLLNHLDWAKTKVSLQFAIEHHFEEFVYLTNTLFDVPIYRFIVYTLLGTM